MESEADVNGGATNGDETPLQQAKYSTITVFNKSLRNTHKVVSRAAHRLRVANPIESDFLNSVSDWEVYHWAAPTIGVQVTAGGRKGRSVFV